jgi:hypothetical protein
METSAVNWLWKVIQEHLKNPLDINEWGIAIEFAKEIEDERIKKAYIDGAINTHNNMFKTTHPCFDENNLTDKLKKLITEKQNLN